MVITKENLRRIKKSSQVPLSNPQNPMGTVPLGEHGPTQAGERKNRLQWVDRGMLPVVQILEEILLEMKSLNDKFDAILNR